MALRRLGTKEPATAPAVERAAKAGGKNRPTPTRASARAAGRRPLVPADRKEAARVARESSRTQRATARTGMLAGDERYLPARDRGPVRRVVRDVVDARHNIGENLIIIALVILVLQFLVPTLLRTSQAASQVVLLGGSALLYSTLLLIIGDSVLLRRRIRRAVTERFGEEAGHQKGLATYGIMRSLQLRRGRAPGVGVPRGAPPR